MPNQRPFRVSSTLAAGLGLAITAIVWAFLILNTSRGHIGNFMDDGEYFLGAMALADRGEYVLESRPFSPPATKYPVGLPLLLAASMKLAPADVTPQTRFFIGRGVIVLCGLVFLAFGYFFFLRLGASPWVSAAILGATPFTLSSIQISMSTMSDVPFGMLSLILFHRWLRPERKKTRASYLIDGALAGAAMLIRSIGVTLVISACLAALVHKRRLRAAIPVAFAAIAIIGLGKWVGRPPSGIDPGLTETYVSDFSIYKSAGILAVTLRDNLVHYLGAIIASLVPILSSRTSEKYELSALALKTAAVIALTLGIFLFARHRDRIRHAPMALHFVLTFAVLLVWPWKLGLRPWLAFLPFFVLLGIDGVRYIARQKSQFLVPAALGFFVLSAVAVGAVNIKLNWKRSPDPEFQEGLDYIRSNLKRNDVIVSQLPETVFLYTGNQAIKGLLDKDHIANHVGSWEAIDRWSAATSGRRMYYFESAPDRNSSVIEKRHTAALLEERPESLRELYRTRNGTYWIAEISR